MMWFKREPKPVSEKTVENGIVGKLRKKKPVLLQPTRESSERETSTESDKERRRYSDILDITVSQERRDESDESLYESADGHSDAISASDDALSRLKTPAISKESLKLAVTDEEVEIRKKGHRKTLSLSNPLEIVKNLGDEWFDTSRHDRNFDKKKSRESLWSEEDRESMHGSSMKLDQIRKDSKKDKNQPSSRKSSTTDPPKARKSSKRSSVGALSFLRRKKTSTTTGPIEAVAEDSGKSLSIEEILNYTKLFLDFEKRHSSECESRPPAETDSEDEPPTPKQIAEHRRRLSRQTSRSKSKARGKSQSLKVNTLRKSHSGTLKKGKKKSVKTPSAGRSRQASIVEQTPILVKKSSDSLKQNSWLFSGSKGESRREGSTDEPTAPDADVDTSDANTKEPDKDTNWRTPAPGGRGVNRAESCRERDAPRRGKHRNASDPNRLTAHNNHDLEPGAPAAPSGSSSSSSLSSRSNESSTVAVEQQASQSDWSEEDEPLAAQWTDSLPPHVLDSLVLSARLRKRQEVIHELIVSEGSHVRWLKVLGGVFLRPLESQGTLLPSEELRALFPNLPGVRERHARLYADLRALRTHANPNDPIVQIRPVADAMLNTLGESGYAACLSKFCRGQRMALEALRERRRKNKELHQFLASREQLPLCGRLQLRDLLACVWQRLTKYQLLLEGVVKTVCDSDCESEEDVARLTRALAVAKDVLHRVDTAIRTAENEHRLRTIQSKLEVRVPSGPDWEELRRLDLTQHQLRMEGDLSIRNDSNKKINVLALMLEDTLVLIQREGDKFVLKPISQPSSSQHQQLSPLIKWDKVLFRPNAAVRNTFFLMNINGVQMHELSANTAPEYATWVKYIQESPLAKLTELKPIVTPSHQHSRSADDSGINVSRNPSDASEKSTSTAPPEEPEVERDRVSLERSSTEREREELIERDPREEKKSVEREERRSVDKDEVADREEKQTPRRPTVGRISTHGEQGHDEAGALLQLEPSAALHVHEPAAAQAATAVRAYTHAERLRRLDEVIRNGLAAKSNIVAEILGVPKHCYAEVADLAVAEALGQVDVSRELRAFRGHLTRCDSVEELSPPAPPVTTTIHSTPDLHHLLLAAQTQANQLTRSLSLALCVSETAAVSARTRGRCDHCHCRARTEPAHTPAPTPAPAGPVSAPPHTDPPQLDKSGPVELESEVKRHLGPLVESSLDRDMSFDMLAELDAHTHDYSGEGSVEDNIEWGVSGAELASRLAGAACGLQRTLSVLLAALPAHNTHAQDEMSLRAEIAALRDNNDALRARLQHENRPTEEIPFPKGVVDPSVQDQPTNGSLNENNENIQMYFVSSSIDENTNH